MKQRKWITISKEIESRAISNISQNFEWYTTGAYGKGGGRQRLVSSLRKFRKVLFSPLKNELKIQNIFTRKYVLILQLLHELPTKNTCYINRWLPVYFVFLSNILLLKYKQIPRTLSIDSRSVYTLINSKSSSTQKFTNCHGLAKVHYHWQRVRKQNLITRLQFSIEHHFCASFVSLTKLGSIRTKAVGKS